MNLKYKIMNEEDFEGFADCSDRDRGCVRGVFRVFDDSVFAHRG